MASSLRPCFCSAMPTAICAATSPGASSSTLRYSVSASAGRAWARRTSPSSMCADGVLPSFTRASACTSARGTSWQVQQQPAQALLRPRAPAGSAR